MDFVVGEGVYSDFVDDENAVGRLSFRLICIWGKQSV